MIDLTLYTAKKCAYLRKIGAHCVYVVAPDNDGPTKIGIALNLRFRMAQIQTGNWLSLGCSFVLWCPGIQASSRVEQKTHDDFCDRKIIGEWYRVTPIQAELAVRMNAEAIFPTCEFLSHEQQMNKLWKKVIERRDGLHVS